MSDQPSFGIDAPGLVAGFAIGGAVLLAVAATLQRVLPAPLVTAVLITGAIMAIEAIWMTWSSLRGKPHLLRGVADALRLRGDEQVLDVGCGRGMLLIELARRLPRGRATGIDRWSRRDQSGNAAAATAHNVALAGVAGRVHIDTGDMRALPYPDASFDAVTASIAVHNLATADERRRAIREMARVLKPDGRIALVDFRHTRDYAAALRAAGLTVQRSAPHLGMFPWVRIVHAHKA